MELHKLYEALLHECGQPSGQWDLWCRRPKTLLDKERVIVESVLTQRTRWENVCASVRNLENERLLTLQDILNADSLRLMEAIRPSGFYRIKTERIKGIADFFITAGGITSAERLPTENLRIKLLKLKGIGMETADDILLYAFERPVFVIDEYTRRLVNNLSLTEKKSYSDIQRYFEDNLDADYALFQDFHALIVIAGKSGKDMSG